MTKLYLNFIKAFWIALLCIGFFSVAPGVSAQYCQPSGGRCVQGGTIWSCLGGSNAGEDCDDDSQCPNSDCHPFAYCGGGNGSISCSGYPGCSASCPSGYCAVGISCSAVHAQPTSTPRPPTPTTRPSTGPVTPTPTPRPGTPTPTTPANSCTSGLTCGGSDSDCGDPAIWTCNVSSNCCEYKTPDPTCVIRETYKQSVNVIRVVSNEGGQTIAWKGNQNNDPVIFNDGVDPAIDGRASAAGLDASGNFISYRPAFTASPIGFDTNKNRINTSMNLTVSGTILSAGTRYGTNCPDKAGTHITDAHTLWGPEQWSHKFCGGIPTQMDGSNRHPQLVDFCLNAGDDIRDYASMTAFVQRQIDGNTLWNPGCDTNPATYQPVLDWDGCTGALSSRALAGGYWDPVSRPGQWFYTPNINPTTSDMLKIAPLVAAADSVNPLDLAYEGFWSATYKNHNVIKGDEEHQLESVVRITPPSGYKCVKNTRYHFFNTDSNNDLRTEDDPSPDDCTIEIEHGQEDDEQFANFIVIEIEKEIVAGGRVVIQNVLDGSGAPVPAPEVPVTLLAPSGEFNTTTNSDGRYTFTGILNIGDLYAVRVNASSTQGALNNTNPEVLSGFTDIGRAVTWQNPKLTSGSITQTRNSSSGNNINVGSGGYESQVAGSSDCGSDFGGVSGRCWFGLTAVQPTVSKNIYCAPSYGLQKNDAYSAAWTNSPPYNTYYYLDVKAGSGSASIPWIGGFANKLVSGSTSTTYTQGFTHFGQSGLIEPRINRYFRFFNGDGHYYHPTNQMVQECGTADLTVNLDGQPYKGFDTLGFQAYNFGSGSGNGIPFNPNKQQADGSNPPYYYNSANRNATTFPVNVEIPYNQNPTNGQKVGAIATIPSNILNNVNVSIVASPTTTGGGGSLNGQEYRSGIGLGYLWPYWSSLDSAGGYLKRNVTINLTTRPPTCSAAIVPVSATVNLGENLNVQTNVTNAQYGTVSNVAYATLVNPGTISPGLTSTSPYSSVYTATTVGTTTLRASVSMQSAVTGAASIGCTADIQIIVPAPRCDASIALQSSIINPTNGGNPGQYPTAVNVNTRAFNVQGGNVGTIAITQLGAGSPRLNLNPNPVTVNGARNTEATGTSVASAIDNTSGSQQMRADVNFSNVPPSMNPICTITTAATIPTPTGGPTPTNIPLCVAFCQTGLSCGEFDRCAGNCPNTNAGVPAVPNLGLATTAGGSFDGGTNRLKMMSTTDQVIVTSNAAATPPPTTHQDIIVYDRRAYAGGGSQVGATAAFANCNSNTTSTNTNTKCYLNQVANSTFTFLPTSQMGYELVVASRAINRHCSGLFDKDGNPINERYSEWRVQDVNLVADITAPVHVENDLNACGSGVPITNISTMTGITARANSDLGVYPGELSGYTFTFRDLPYHPNSSWAHPYQLRLSISNPTRAASSPGSEVYCGCTQAEDAGDRENCLASVGVDSSFVTPTVYTFKVAQIPSNLGSWWQVINGNAYSRDAMNSQIPQLDDAGRANYPQQISPGFENLRSGLVIPAIPFLTLPAPVGAAATQGIPGSNNSVSTGTPPTTLWARQENPQQHIPNSSDQPIENYEHFMKKIDVESEGEVVSSTLGNLPDNDVILDVDNLEVYYATGDVVIDPNTTWVINADQKVVIFVAGNVTIQNGADLDQLFQVKTGGFFGIISGGTITFANDVGHDHYVGRLNPNISWALFGMNAQPALTADNETNADIEGVFIADTITIAATPVTTPDKKFIGAGSFIGTTGFNLNRKFYSTVLDPAYLSLQLNNYSPTEVFIYRPDFLINFPEALMDANLIWQEVDSQQQAP